MVYAIRVTMTTATETNVTVKVKRASKPFKRPKKQPLYHVILLDDDDHTYEYVIGMLGRLFGYQQEKAYELASQVDNAGQVVVDTTTLERAELKRDQIHAFGRDWRIPRCQGSMSATLEPVPE